LGHWHWTGHRSRRCSTSLSRRNDCQPCRCGRSMDYHRCTNRHRLGFANCRASIIRRSPAGPPRQSDSHAHQPDVHLRKAFYCARFPARPCCALAKTIPTDVCLLTTLSKRLRLTSVTHTLVTGGSGFIGQHLVTTLLARGRRVRVLDRRPPACAPKRVQYVA